jgi:hypothetical protein
MTTATVSAKRVAIDDILKTPAALRRAAATLRRDAATARRMGWPSEALERIAGECTALVEQRIRLESTDRHTRAMAQAEAAGIATLRELRTSAA